MLFGVGWEWCAPEPVRRQNRRQYAGDPATPSAMSVFTSPDGYVGETRRPLDLFVHK
jgi:hypothetical protein